ncbi:phenazine antibiotic biosynthesis protein [Streptomyces kunmingensis]|uniref:Phenazine antibiotic biosynthesis protein n=1 Tax=Streptomyces kunmingensis TaxID=68225 RepID=A0ABU6C8G8_9ACTN|nr:phenazine antibiotic biosynthesis protein [Streptomyces kunmingensis]MEB3960928.1 phenazine antibiotic biosynthesis protein [Streptomyces kunmingensis]
MPYDPATVLDAGLSEGVDPDAFVRAAVHWHFDPETGSRFWLDRAPRLGFDPRQDIKGVADLALFPDLTHELRDIPAADLVPRGYGTRAGLLNVFDSGGTTGAPKRVVQLADWERHSTHHVAHGLRAHGLPTATPWLSVAPTGPHLVGDVLNRAASSLGGPALGIDMDPRWVRKLAAAGRTDEVVAYTDHLVDQCRRVLLSQDIGVLAATTALLERLAREDDLLDAINSKVRAIVWGGTHMDPDTRFLLSTEVFPGVPLVGMYGNTMMLTGLIERVGQSASQPCVFDPVSPSVFLSVVDPASREPVALGARGQVVVSHVSKSMLIPNNAERDTAVRVAPAAGQVGDAVADVAPMPTVAGTTVIEGVY